MKIGRLFPDLLATLGRAASPEAGFARTLRRLVEDSGAVAGGLLFTPAGGSRIQVTVGARPGSALETWLGQRLASPREACPSGRCASLHRVAPPRAALPASREPRRARGARGSLRPARARRPRRPARRPDPARLSARSSASSMAQVWQLHQRTRRLGSGQRGHRARRARRWTCPASIRRWRGRWRRLIRFSALGVGLLDRERQELRLVDIVVSPDDPLGAASRAMIRLPSAGSIAQWVAEQRAPIRIDDLSDPRLPPVSRERFRGRGFHSAVLAPLITQGERDRLPLRGPLHRPRAFGARTSRSSPRWRAPAGLRHRARAAPRRDACVAPRPWARSTRRAGSSARGCTCPPCSPPSAGR